VSSPLSFLKSSKTVLDIPQNAHAQSLKWETEFRKKKKKSENVKNHEES
jgi:hypothetical protein